MPQQERSMELYTLFKSVVRKATDEWNRRNPEQLPISHFRLLYLLDAHGQQKIAELAERLLVTSGAVTGMADRLIERGLVARNRDRNDRRVVHLTLTEEGRALFARLGVMHQAFYGRIFGQLQDEDIDHLMRIFSQLIQTIDQLSEE